MTNQNRFHVIKDPVHGTMQFTDIEDSWVKPFINSAHFQRLRHIKQLGMGDFIFPGAVHTRFNHSLGCCYIGSQIAHKIGLSDEERQLVMIACLLHDLGHGPFSHAFEDVFHEKLIRHEDWTPFFLADYRSSEFFEDYNNHNPRHALTEAKFRQVESMIMHQAKAKGVLADIVSSQLDADRLDYLLRDSHFCGVGYGHFDFRWMLHCMAIVNDGQQERLGITHKGIGAVEHYLMARRLMIRNIYYSQKKLALEYYLVKLLAILAKELDSGAYTEIKNTRLGTFLCRANQFNEAAKTQQDIKRLKQNFLQDCYPIYKELCDYDVFSLINRLVDLRDQRSTSQLAARLQYREIPKIVRLDFMNVSYVEGMVTEFKSSHAKTIQDWQVALIKTPNQSYIADSDPILVVNEQNQICPINERSLMINAISDKYEQTAFLCIDRPLMTHQSVSELLKKVASEVEVQAGM